MFQQPNTSSGDVFKPAEHLGRLVLIYARSFRENVPTSFGAADAVAADIHVIDNPGGPAVFTNALLFQRAIVASLRDAVGGDPVLARIGQGVAKPGQTAPYVLQPFTDADAQVATTYVNSLPKQPFQQAAPAAQQQTAPAPAATVPAPGPLAQLGAAMQAAHQTPAPAAAAPAQTIDPTNLPPDVAQLLAQLQGQAATA